MISSELETRELITPGGPGFRSAPPTTKRQAKRETMRRPAQENGRSVPKPFVDSASVDRRLSRVLGIVVCSPGVSVLPPRSSRIGDTFGEVPNELITFINDGGYQQSLPLRKELTATFSLKGTVIYGHCAGGTTAVYAAAGAKSVRGLILSLLHISMRLIS